MPVAAGRPVSAFDTVWNSTPAVSHQSPTPSRGARSRTSATSGSASTRERNLRSWLTGAGSPTALRPGPPPRARRGAAGGRSSPGPRWWGLARSDHPELLAVDVVAGDAEVPEGGLHRPHHLCAGADEVL